MAPIGVDDWVSRSEERKEAPEGWRGSLHAVTQRVGWWPRLWLAVAAGALFPLIANGNPYLLQVGFNAVLLATLALGLNIAVGWAGLLDLGYVAFYGFGAYGYALLSSPQIAPGIHLPAIASIPIVMVTCALLGLLVGLPSRRLIGDYLAIVTLFFGEVFVEFTTNVAPKTFGGPNGITDVDPIHSFGGTILSTQGYFYLALVVVVVLIGVLHLLDTSRTGRAWRAVREDPLAAALMTIPVNRVKLMAFGFGAAAAALAGSMFAADQAGVYPTDFNTEFLILIYAGLILGGSGSIAGAVLGGLVVSVTLELLRSPVDSGYIFYGLVLLTLVVRLRPWRKLGLVLASVVALGVAIHAIVAAISSQAVAGSPGSGGWIGSALNNYVVVPAHATTYGNVLFVALVCAIVALSQLKGTRRLVLMVPTIYLAACCWEARLSTQPSITREILIGAILIVTMNARPYGLLGSRKVEVG